MIARTVISLESADGTVLSRWTFRYEDVGPDRGTALYASAQCMAFANEEIASHVLCVSVINSLTAIARWGDK